MLSFDHDPELQVRQWSDALVTAQRLLAQREEDIDELRALSRKLEEELNAERRRAEMLAALSDRFGLR